MNIDGKINKQMQWISYANGSLPKVSIVGAVLAILIIFSIHCGKALAVIIIVLIAVARIARRIMCDMQSVQIGFVVDLK